MSNEKKSFVGYCDWLSSFEMLEDVEAGKLIKHLLRYVNRQKPTTEDRLINIAFQPMRMQLKRDLEKYDEVRKKRSEAGKKGGLKTHEKANQANDSFVKQKQSNQAVNVNDNVTVNVNDKKRSTDVDTKTDNARDFNSLNRESYFSVSMLAELFSGNDKIMDSVAKTTGRSVGQLKNYLPEFVLHLQAEGRGTEQPAEFARYFRNKVKLDSTFQRKHKTNNTGEYQWIFKGTTRQKGDQAAYENAKMNFDKAGFGFKTLKTPAHAQ